MDNWLCMVLYPNKPVFIIFVFRFILFLSKKYFPMGLFRWHYESAGLLKVGLTHIDIFFLFYYKLQVYKREVFRCCHESP